MSTNNRVAIVGGASSGLGYAIAEDLLRQGHRTVIVSRSEERITEAADALRDPFGDARQPQWSPRRSSPLQQRRESHPESLPLYRLPCRSLRLLRTRTRC